MKEIAVAFAASTVLAAAPAGVEIPIEKYKLSNGLRVLLSQDNAAPVVAVYVIYGVGARSEEKGRTGFAHLFEHMMFQGSKNAPKGVHFKTVESNGGDLNGSTHPDYTDYFEVLPSNKLAVALWLESDRMRSLAITKENLDNQKEAVKQERRLNFDNQPYATAIVDVFPTVAFKNWSSSHSLIGSFEDLNAASVEDVSGFFKTHYAPNNAVLAIVGDIRIPETKRLIEQYFGNIPSQPQPKPPDLTEPEQTEPRKQTYKDPLARVPTVVIAYPGPKRRSEDFYTMLMIDVILTGGESSRLYQDLIKGKKSVISYEANLGWPFAGPTDYVDPGIYATNLTYNPQFKAAQIVQQYEAEVDALKNTPVPADELERARTYLRSSRIKELQSTMRRAALMAQYELLDGKPEYINTEIAELMKVTPERIQAAAKKYFVANKQTVFDIIPAPKGAK